MDSNAFIQLLGVLNKEENRRVKQIWQGKIANKIDRVNDNRNRFLINNQHQQQNIVS